MVSDLAAPASQDIHSGRRSRDGATSIHVQHLEKRAVFQHCQVDVLHTIWVESLLLSIFELPAFVKITCNYRQIV